MSFLVTAALAIGVLIALPAIAHFLRSGRAAVKPFPPAALVQAARTVARSERRLEDRLLLALRALAVIMLALVGATPFVSCSRLSLARGAGGSLAVAIVFDDSLSMRAARGGGATRFERARDAARQLLDSTREGDSVSIVLAGRPARLALGATTDLRIARRTLDELAPSDRATDLAAALVLARGSLRDAERRELSVVVLSDFAGPPLADNKDLSAPLPELTRAAPDCGIASAERQGDRVTATVACNRAVAAEGRALEIVPLAGSGVDPSPSAGSRKPSTAAAIARAPLDTRAGTQVVSIKLPPNAPPLALRLNGSDALPHDDLAAVAPDTLALGVAVLADTALSSGETGGPPLVEQAIRALETKVALRPLAVLPDQTTELDGYGLLVLDDPAGLSPEARAALTAWVERGGMALSLLGPRAETTKLGSPLEPFVLGSVRWQRPSASRGVKPETLGWLGPEAASLADVAPEGRALFDAGRIPGARVLATFDDGAPFLVERDLGRGLVSTLSLPSSAAESDFALRPGFVALLDHYLDAARQRRGLAQSTAGVPWNFGSERPIIQGPEGPLELGEQASEGRTATPALRGLYRVKLGSREELRTVTLDADELSAEPNPPTDIAARSAGARRSQRVDASAEVGSVLVALLFFELLLRIIRFVRAGRSARNASA
jgi:hypothetical protein